MVSMAHYAGRFAYPTLKSGACAHHGSFESSMFWSTIGYKTLGNATRSGRDRAGGEQFRAAGRDDIQRIVVYGLLVSQSNQGVHAHGAARREVAGGERDDREQDDDTSKGERVGCGHAEQQA
jgi:hypothetical protein